MSLAILLLIPGNRWTREVRENGLPIHGKQEALALYGGYRPDDRSSHSGSPSNEVTELTVSFVTGAPDFDV